MKNRVNNEEVSRVPVDAARFQKERAYVRELKSV